MGAMQRIYAKKAPNIFFQTGFIGIVIDGLDFQCELTHGIQLLLAKNIADAHGVPFECDNFCKERFKNTISSYEPSNCKNIPHYKSPDSLEKLYEICVTSYAQFVGDSGEAWERYDGRATTGYVVTLRIGGIHQLSCRVESDEDILLVKKIADYHEIQVTCQYWAKDIVESIIGCPVKFDPLRRSRRPIKTTLENLGISKIEIPLKKNIYTGKWINPRSGDSDSIEKAALAYFELDGWRG